MFRPSSFALSLALSLVAFQAGCSGKGSEAPATPVDPYAPQNYREAASITAKGVLEVMGSARAGQTEGDQKGVLDAAFRRGGSTELAFPHIVATGANALSLHYEGSAGVLKNGDLLLLDVGAKNNGIASDCSRTFPVGATFTPRQRELYQLVLEAQRAAETGFRVNVSTLADLDDLASAVMMSSPLRALDAKGKSWTLDHFFIHFVGHFVGKQVHAEDLLYTSKTPLKPGMVITLEPGVYVESEGIGIRIEDTYLVTDRGLEPLTTLCPKEIPALEALRKSPMTLEVPKVQGLKAAEHGPHLVVRGR